LRETIYHLVTKSELRTQAKGDTYLPTRFGQDGFIHCTGDPDTVLAVANDYFSSVEEPVLVLVIETAKVTAAVRFEPPAPVEGSGTSHLEGAQLFPHIYGPLNLCSDRDRHAAGKRWSVSVARSLCDNKGVEIAMKKIGLIGGIGPESTLDYYRRTVDAFRASTTEPDYPEIVIYSANLTELMAILKTGDMAKLSDYLVEKMQALHRAGADFAAIGSNTPHVVFEEVAARSPIPLVSIVEATRQKAAGLGLKRLGLMGTLFTMQSDFYPRAFAASGMSVVVPSAESQQLIQERLFSEIELGIIKDSTREELLAIARRMVDRDAIEGIILGCTELPLILDQESYDGIPFLNTTAIHVESIVEYCRG